MERSTRRTFWLVTIALAALALGTSGSLAFGGSRTPVRSQSLIPTTGAWFGAHVHKRTEKTEYDAVLAFEKEIGRKFAIDNHFEDWNNPTLKEEPSDLAAGRIPMISWPGGAWPAGVNATTIASGSQDGAITYMANQLKALHKPVLLRFAFEMDRSGRSIGTASQFIAAWKHAHDIFVKQGATNVKWVWCPVSHDYANGVAQTYYPGGSYVDWIAADGFSFWPVKDTSKGTWRSLHDIFSAFYTWGSTKGKPLMIASTGVQEDPTQPTRKAQWFQDVLTTLKAWPKVKAFVYYNGTTPTPNGTASFYADSSSSSLKAYASIGADPYFNPPSPY